VKPRKKQWKEARLSLKRSRGVILSTEMMLLLTAVIIFAVIAFFGMSHMILSQATSSKQTLVLVNAKAWQITQGLAVSVYLQNTGDKSITIDSIGIKFEVVQNYNVYYGTCTAPVSVTINPGESKVISVAFGEYTCNGVQYLVAGTNIYVFANAGTNQVGQAVTVLAPT